MLLSAPMSLEECLERVRSGPVPPHEEAAKFQLIAPILRNLGWNPDDGAEFLLEHSVGGTGGKVDIALKGDGRLVALVEAKAPNADLSQHVEQVLRYAFHEGVDICVLTTGLEWWLFLPREKGEWAERRFAVLDLEADSVDRLTEDFNAFLNRHTLVSGQAEAKAKLVLRARLAAARLEKEIPKIWRTMRDAPDEELIELIGARVYEKLNLRPEKSQVIAVLRGEPVPMLDVPTGSPPPNPEVDSGRKTARRPTRRPVAILLWGTRYPVSTHTQILHAVADRLYERHARDFDTVLDLKGKRVPWAALNPEGFRGSFQIKGSPYFVNTHGNAAAIRKRAEKFLEHFGYDESDLEVVFE